ncbi:hypothetical protein BT69DRAFT_1282588, partial [Atractiella rhizophila]
MEGQRSMREEIPPPVTVSTIVLDPLQPRPASALLVPSSVLTCLHRWATKREG